MTAFDLPSDVELIPEGSEKIAPEGRAVCPDCGRDFKVNADGSLRAHNCGDKKIRGTSKSKTAKRTKSVPESVQRVGTAAIASGVEFVAALTVASYIPCPREQVPSEVVTLPDSDAMVGPLVRAMWPQLPAKAQRLVASVCDHEDAILALLAWWEWFSKLQKFAQQAHKIVTEANAAQEVGKVSDGVQGQTRESNVVNGSFGGVQPFQPVTG